MNKIAKFEKISFEQFKKDFGRALNLSTDNPTDLMYLQEIYENIHLPRRATSGSAGYDFFLPYNIETSFSSSALIPTGIKCDINDGWVLQIYPRSSFGIKYGIRLSNTVGIIDSDYYNNPDNEGHIWVELVMDDKHGYLMHEFFVGDGFCQGLFVPCGITTDDNACGVRIGGIGSTDKNGVLKND